MNYKDAGKVSGMREPTYDISKFIHAPNAAHFLQTYFGVIGSTPYTGGSWDAFIARRRKGELANRFELEDFYGPTLLSVAIPGKAALAILNLSEDITDLLISIPADAQLWSPTISDELVTTTAKLLRLIHGPDISGVHSTKASKLLAAKRPEWMPIWDTVVLGQLGITGQPFWEDYIYGWHNGLQVNEVVDQLEELRNTLGEAHQNVSLLRIADVIIWMHGQHGTS